MSLPPGQNSPAARLTTADTLRFVPVVSAAAREFRASAGALLGIALVLALFIWLFERGSAALLENVDAEEISGTAILGGVRALWCALLLMTANAAAWLVVQRHSGQRVPMILALQEALRGFVVTVVATAVLTLGLLLPGLALYMLSENLVDDLGDVLYEVGAALDVNVSGLLIDNGWDPGVVTAALFLSPWIIGFALLGITWLQEGGALASARRSWALTASSKARLWLMSVAVLAVALLARWAALEAFVFVYDRTSLSAADSSFSAHRYEILSFLADFLAAFGFALWGCVLGAFYLAAASGETALPAMPRVARRVDADAPLGVVRPSSPPLNPLTAISTLIMLVSGLIALNRLSVWIPPVVLVIALVGMAAAAIAMRRGAAGADQPVRALAGTAPPAPARAKARSSQTAPLRANAKATKRGEVDHAYLQSMAVAHYLPWLKDQVRGQAPVIDAIFSELERNLRLAKIGRPLGAFLLVGPTGTGKTFLAQLIAQALFPSSAPVMLRMNQYKLEQDVYTLLGPPPGVPGFEVGGTLTRPVLENPYRGVVFDEIEKAHKDVHHCLYDVLDVAGCREKSSGRSVDFSGTVFFATCNAAVEELRRIRENKTDVATWQAKSRDALADAAGFDRAFLARWTGIYLMDELAPMHIAEVACLQLARHWKEYDIDLAYASPEVLLAAVQGNDEFRQYGVRQLATFLREQTKDAIIAAKNHGATTVWLGADEAGRLAITEMTAADR